MMDYITREKADAYKKQADAYNAYMDFQNKQVGIICDYVEKGGVISPKLSNMVDEFQKKSLIELKKYIIVQQERIEKLQLY